MLIKQLSVFLENREGRLEKVTETLLNHNININSFSLADTKEYGLLRMIVSDPDKAKEVLKEEGFSAMLTNVIAVKLPQQVGGIHKLLKELASNNVNVEYMYTMITIGNDASIILKLGNMENAVSTLEKLGYELLPSSKAYFL